MKIQSTIVSCALAIFSYSANAQDKLIPIDAFVQEQQFSSPRLSPDGKHIAINVRIKRGDRTIPTMTIYSLPELKIVSTIIMQGYEIPVNFEWVSNQRLVVEKGIELGYRERPSQTGEIVSVNLDGSKPEYLYGYKGYTQSTQGNTNGSDEGFGNISQIQRSGDGIVLVESHEWEGKSSILFSINSLNSRRKTIANIGIEDLGFVIQHDGQPRFAYGSNNDNQPILFRFNDTKKEWLKVDDSLLGSAYHPFAFSNDDSSVFVYSSSDGGPYSIVQENMSTGKRQTVVEGVFGSIDMIEYTAKPHLPFAATIYTGIPRARYINPDLPDAVLHKTLSASFPDAYVHFINFTDDGNKLLFSVSSDRDPGAYYLFDRSNMKAELLFLNMPNIDAEKMAERRPVRFKARDGLEITGYLTLPKRVGNKKLPMILLPHGGPFDVHDDWFFDTDSQFLASRGYAVLQVNFRGSSGRGLNFKEAGYREWGGKIMNDLIDGVKWANALPDIDSNRVCVYGASFGGYAAMMLPVREPTMFKCAVGYSGRYDLAGKYLQDNVKGEEKITNYFIKTMGNDPVMLAQNSPINLADKIKIPVFLIHGGKDKTTEIKQAEIMRDALIKAGNPAEWMLVGKEGHGFYDSEYRKNFYEKLEAFLGKHLSQ